MLTATAYDANDVELGKVTEITADAASLLAHQTYPSAEWTMITGSPVPAVEKAPKFALTVHGPNLGTKGADLHVHTAECADNGKKLYQSEQGWTFEFESIKDVVLSNYGPDEFDYEERDWADFLTEFKFFPCTKNVPMGE